MFSTIFYGLFVLVGLYLVVTSVFGRFEYSSSRLTDRVIISLLWLGVLSDMILNFLKSLGH